MQARHDDWRSWLFTPAVASVPRELYDRPVAAEGNVELGTVGLFEVLTIGADENIELLPTQMLGDFSSLQTPDSFATRPLLAGDLFVGAVGGRYATSYFHAAIPDEIGGANELLTFGGVVGAVKSRNTGCAVPTKVRCLRLFHTPDDRLLNTRQFAPPFRKASEVPSKYPLVLVVGASMDSGKTTAAQTLIRSASQTGHSVAAGKVTGCCTRRDPHRLKAAGAEIVADFAMFGFPSTAEVGVPAARDLFRHMLGYLQEQADSFTEENRLIVLELADSMLQEETFGILTDSGVRNCTSGVIFAAPDPLAAYGGLTLLEQLGYSRVAVSGPLTNSELHELELRNAFPNSNLKILPSSNWKEPEIGEEMATFLSSRC